MSKFKDLIGKKFGKWFVIKYLGKQYWLCRCDCGKKGDIYAGNLLAGNTTQCMSCSKTKYSCLKNNNKLKRLYKYWEGKIRNHREIIYSEWANDFIIFKDFALANGYSNEKRYLILKDKNGVFEPNNCEWSEKVKPRGHKIGRLLAYNGKTQNLVSWAKELNITRQALFDWLQRGKTLEQAFNKAFNKDKYKCNYNSKYRRMYGFTLKELSEKMGVSMDTVYKRLRGEVNFDN